MLLLRDSDAGDRRSYGVARERDGVNARGIVRRAVARGRFCFWVSAFFFLCAHCDHTATLPLGQEPRAKAPLPIHAAIFVILHCVHACAYGPGI
jgi:hypothetical protein